MARVKERAPILCTCRWGRRALTLRWPRAQVIGIDVSATGIQQTEKLKRKHGIENHELQQLPVERAVELGRSFEHVTCTGVLHRLPGPDKGLRALHDVLMPELAMHLIIYAPYGRAGVYLLQDYCRRGVAAGVLNKSHTCTDICLPFDTHQKKLFDVIDGKRTIGEIAPQAALRDAAKVLFEGL
jgi:SAM-dependent methyltransferase